MNPILAGVALAVTAGVVIAVSAREGRAALVGLAVALVAAPFLGDPLPQISTLATRVVGAALTAYLLRAAVVAAPPLPIRGPRRPGGSRIGWPAEVLVAAAAWLVAFVLSDGLAGLAPGGGTAPSTGPTAMLTPAAVTTAAGLAAMILAIVPALGGPGALRTAIGSLLLIQGILVFRAGVAGAPGDLEQLGGVMLLVAIGVAGAWLIGAEGRRVEADSDAPDALVATAADDLSSGPAR